MKHLNFTIASLLLWVAIPTLVSCGKEDIMPNADGSDGGNNRSELIVTGNVEKARGYSRSVGNGFAVSMTCSGYANLQDSQKPLIGTDIKVGIETCYSEDFNYTSSEYVDDISEIDDQNKFSVNVTFNNMYELEGGETVYYRAYISIGSDTQYGQVKSYTLPAHEELYKGAIRTPEMEVNRFNLSGYGRNKEDYFDILTFDDGIVCGTAPELLTRANVKQLLSKKGTSDAIGYYISDSRSDHFKWTVWRGDITAYKPESKYGNILIKKSDYGNAQTLYYAGYKGSYATGIDNSNIPGNPTDKQGFYVLGDIKSISLK